MLQTFNAKVQGIALSSLCIIRPFNHFGPSSYGQSRGVIGTVVRNYH